MRWLSVLACGCSMALIAAGRSGTADQKAVQTETVEFRGSNGAVKGFLAKPQGSGPFPAIIVVHEWWGLADWIKQNAERLAGQGYIALAVDLYGGKVTNDPGEAHELMRALDHGEAVADLKGGIAYLKSRKDVAPDQKIGVIGWCMGGGIARELAQASDAIGPTVICYGAVSNEAAQIDKLAGKPVLGIFGAEDRGIPVPRVEQFASALKTKGSQIELHIYKGAGHGFMRPGGPQYHAEAAADAWKQIDDFLADHLKK
ncbi:MAG: dienelactone hydrolase family protein [Isosphaeraceae bacterium]|nr:dienelactone hydrolase family protein [Isosphaeraceae bacterium]